VGIVEPLLPPETRQARGTRSHRLVSGVVGLGERSGEKGGEKTYLNPVDRGRPGSKRHLLVDRSGVPLAWVLTSAQVYDSKVFEEVVDDVEPVKGPKGRSRKHHKLHADKAYDFPCCWRVLRVRGMKARIVSRDIDSNGRLGRYRWTVESTLARLSGY
jgi:hypothetical protein